MKRSRVLQGRSPSHHGRNEMPRDGFGEDSVPRCCPSPFHAKLRWFPLFTSLNILNYVDMFIIVHISTSQTPKKPSLFESLTNLANYTGTPPYRDVCYIFDQIRNLRVSRLAAALEEAVTKIVATSKGRLKKSDE